MDTVPSLLLAFCKSHPLTHLQVFKEKQNQEECEYFKAGLVTGTPGSSCLRSSPWQRQARRGGLSTRRREELPFGRILRLLSLPGEKTQYKLALAKTRLQAQVPVSSSNTIPAGPQGSLDAAGAVEGPPWPAQSPRERRKEAPVRPWGGLGLGAVPVVPGRGGAEKARRRAGGAKLRPPRAGREGQPRGRRAGEGVGTHPEEGAALAFSGACEPASSAHCGPQVQRVLWKRAQDVRHLPGGAEAGALCPAGHHVVGGGALVPGGEGDTTEKPRRRPFGVQGAARAEEAGRGHVAGWPKALSWSAAVPVLWCLSSR